MFGRIAAALTDKDGNLDIAVVLGLIAFAVFLYLSYHAYIDLKQSFDPMAWGVGAGGLAAGHGAMKMWNNKGDYGQ